MKKLFLPVLFLLCFAYSYQQHKEMKELIDVNAEALTQSEVKLDQSEKKVKTTTSTFLDDVVEFEGNHAVLYKYYLVTETIDCIGEGKISCEPSVSIDEKKVKIL